MSSFLRKQGEPVSTLPGGLSVYKDDAVIWKILGHFGGVDLALLSGIIEKEHMVEWENKQR